MKRSLVSSRLVGLGSGIVPCALVGCGSTASAPAASDGITYRSDVAPVTSVAQAKKGVFIPPFIDCRDPLPGETGSGPSGQVCTNVMISGCTEPGKYFPSYASCDVVRTQRPYFSTPVQAKSNQNDPRLQDSTFISELAWARTQIEAAGCTCCHDSNAWTPASWDIRHEPIWLDTLSDSGLALFVGLADSSSLGAYPAAQNHGFDRTATGIPTTDTTRMKALLLQELARRGISPQQAAQTPPFGGPIYAERFAKPGTCTDAEGVNSDGTVVWTGGGARYVYVLADGTDNPGVPPNLDLPDGTLWRLDVLASADPLPSGIAFGRTPPGSFQTYPEHSPAAPLQRGTRYHFYVLYDVGLPAANCNFVYGEPRPTADAGAGPSSPGPDAGPDATAMSSDAGGGARAIEGGAQDAVACPATEAGNGFGAPCTVSSECPCLASYCAVMPGQTTGYCTRTGCTQSASICPGGWSCLDLSAFSAALPSICTSP